MKAQAVKISPWGVPGWAGGRAGHSAAFCSAPGASQNLALFNQDGTGEEEILICPWPENGEVPAGQN